LGSGGFIQSYSVIRQTWLSQKPHTEALLITLLATFFVVLLSAVSFENLWGLRDLMTASQEKTFELKQWGRLWTTLFVHADAKHLLSNSFLFFILGYFLSGYFGFFVFPAVALLFGGLTNWIVLSGMPSTVSLVGISGVVFWMGGAWLTLYLLLDRQRKLYQRVLRAMGVGLVLFFPAEAFDPQISYKSHWVGFLLGILWGLVYFFWNRRKFRQSEVAETVFEDFESQNPTSGFR